MPIVNRVSDILGSTSHRPWELPQGRWQYYQEWNKVLFFHWAVPADLLRACIPAGLELDTFNGNAYVSLVPFIMQKIRYRYLPSLAAVSDFPEINLRTYIANNGQPGVYFISIEAGKPLSAFMARNLSGLPYEKATVARTDTWYHVENKARGTYLDTEIRIKEVVTQKTALDKWLTERYCLYMEDGGKRYRFHIHHKEWELRNVDIVKLDARYKVGGFNLADRPPALAHYSDGVKVLAWGRETL